MTLPHQTRITVTQKRGVQCTDKEPGGRVPTPGQQQPNGYIHDLQQVCFLFCKVKLPHILGIWGCFLMFILKTGSHSIRQSNIRSAAILWLRSLECWTYGKWDFCNFEDEFFGYMCLHVYTHEWGAHLYRGQKSMSSISLSCFPILHFDTRLLTEPATAG